MDTTTRKALELALSELKQTLAPSESAARKAELRDSAIHRLETLLNNDPEVKDPLGGNIDVTIHRDSVRRQIRVPMPGSESR